MNERTMLRGRAEKRKTSFGWIGLRGHQLRLSAIGTDDVFFFVRDKATSDKWWLANATDKAIIVPMTVFKADETCATNAYNNEKQTHLRTSKNQESSIVITSDGLGASSASLCKQLSEAIGTVRFLITAGKALASQWNLTMSASEAFTMPWIVLVCYATGCNDLNKWWRVRDKH